ncbi:MAG: Uma2 family endonuclease [Acidobacteriaceae bacterium]|nr:Uma2 family endonuclease [Acidobacteriaceae bacterium]MBV9223660.1 Uma2 family endonuclease [Acidobacteriaceae bacterium]MBV9937003.1 Uma2 family endonuclease [Acidobacteriaceae bacterium]
MATATSPPLISTEEYIARFVEGGEKPTCEYIDGELRPKPMPTREHSQVQLNIIRQVVLNNEEQLQALPELTTRLRTTKFYVPDIAVEELARPIQGRYPGPGDPVFLCVEIKSPDDRIGKLFSKCEEYHSWGVPHCWVIDPERKIAWEYTPDDAEPRKADTVLNAGAIQIALTEIFRRV